MNYSFISEPVLENIKARKAFKKSYDDKNNLSVKLNSKSLDKTLRVNLLSQGAIVDYESEDGVRFAVSSEAFNLEKKGIVPVTYGHYQDFLFVIGKMDLSTVQIEKDENEREYITGLLELDNNSMIFQELKNKAIPFSISLEITIDKAEALESGIANVKKFSLDKVSIVDNGADVNASGIIKLNNLEDMSEEVQNTTEEVVKVEGVVVTETETIPVESPEIKPEVEVTPVTEKVTEEVVEEEVEENKEEAKLAVDLVGFKAKLEKLQSDFETAKKENLEIRTKYEALVSTINEQLGKAFIPKNEGVVSNSKQSLNKLEGENLDNLMGRI